jgi:hypothetical protein
MMKKIEGGTAVLVCSVALTKYHGLGGLETTEIYFSQF